MWAWTPYPRVYRLTYTPPYLHAGTSTRRQTPVHASQPPNLHTRITRQHTRPHSGRHAFMPSDLHTGTSTRRHTRLRAPDLQTSMPTRLCVGIHAFVPPHLHTSMPVRLQVGIHVSVPAHLHPPLYTLPPPPHLTAASIPSRLYPCWWPCDSIDKLW